MAAANLPTVNHTVLSFCKDAKALEAESHANFVRFVLAGEKDDGTRVVVDPILNAVPNNEAFNVQRDYDSVLGIHKDILVDSHLSVSPIGKANETLSTDVHIKYHFESSKVSSSQAQSGPTAYTTHLFRGHSRLTCIKFRTLASQRGGRVI